MGVWHFAMICSYQHDKTGLQVIFSEAFGAIIHSS